MDVYGKGKGRTGLKLVVKALDPSAWQFGHMVKELSDEIQIQVLLHCYSLQGHSVVLGEKQVCFSCQGQFSTARPVCVFHSSTYAHGGEIDNGCIIGCDHENLSLACFYAVSVKMNS